MLSIRVNTNSTIAFKALTTFGVYTSEKLTNAKEQNDFTTWIKQAVYKLEKKIFFGYSSVIVRVSFHLCKNINSTELQHSLNLLIIIHLQKTG